MKLKVTNERYQTLRLSIDPGVPIAPIPAHFARQVEGRPGWYYLNISLPPIHYVSIEGKVSK